MIRPLLRFGSNGPSVTSLQQALNMGDTDLDLLDEDGIFGAFTLARVKEFQDQEELTPDGIVGPDTHDALEELYQLFAQLKGPMPPGEDDARQTIVAVAQSALTTFGWANTNGLSQPAQLPLPGAPQIAARFGFGKVDAQGNQSRQGGFSLATIFQSAGHPSASKCLKLTSAARKMYADNSEPPHEVRNVLDVPEWCGIFVLYVYKTSGLQVSSWPLKIFGEDTREFDPVRRISDLKPGDFGQIASFGGRNHHFLVTAIDDFSISSIDGNSGLFQSITDPGYTIIDAKADKRGAYKIQTGEPVVFYRPYWKRVLQ